MYNEVICGHYTFDSNHYIWVHFERTGSFMSAAADAILDLGRELFIDRGTRWRSWLGHCDKSRKAASSVPNDVIGTYY